MILVIDTSAATSVVATIEGEAWNELSFNARETSLARQLPYMVHDLDRLTKVAVAIGPGSFTGLRTGVSFGLGLAIGLGIPIVPLPSLALQAARSDEPVTAVGDAGRGRFYFLPPGGEPGIGEAAEVPAAHPLIGRLADQEGALLATGHRFQPESELRPFAEAARILLETAQEVPYRNLEIRYMQTLSARKS